MGLVDDALANFRRNVSTVGRTAQRGAAVAYDATLGPVGHSLRQAPGELGHRFLKGVDATGAAYERTINLLPGAGEQVGRIAEGASNTIGFVVKEVPATVRDLTVPVGRGLGDIGRGIGDLGSGAGDGLDKTGGGVQSFGAYAGIGLVALAAVAAIYVLKEPGGRST